MVRFLRMALALASILSAPTCVSGSAPLEVETYRASEISAHVNAHLLMGELDALLVDATMTLADAEEVATSTPQALKKAQKMKRFLLPFMRSIYLWEGSASS